MHHEFSDRDKIAEQLDRSLGPEFISYRPGCNGVKLTYVEGWLIISIANRLFGFDGWSSEIKSVIQEYSDCKDGKVSVGYSSHCRVTLKNGMFKEDVGFGSADNQRVLGPAIEKAKKEAVTDSLKRALRQFGNALGNCCYDKEFVRHISKLQNLRVAKFDSSKLLKRSDLDDLRDDGMVQNNRADAAAIPDRKDHGKSGSYIKGRGLRYDIDLNDEKIDDSFDDGDLFDSYQ